MVVVGTFTPATPADGAQPAQAGRFFQVYFEAEIEVELAFSPPLVIDGGARSVVVELLPHVWFKRPDGTVLDLSRFDFAATGRIVEFELEMAKGIELEMEN